MILRRAYFWWQFLAVAALPLLLFIARGIVGARMGWDVLGSIVAAPVLAVALLIVAVLVLIRPSVFTTRAVSWFDVGALTAWQLSIIWFCLAPTAGVFALGIVTAMVAFWGAVWQLVTDASRRVAGAVRDFTVEFDAAAARRRGTPIDLGELQPVERGAQDGAGETRRGSVAE